MKIDIEKELKDFKRNVLDETWTRIDGQFGTYDKEIIIDNIRRLIKKIVDGT